MMHVTAQMVKMVTDWPRLPASTMNFPLCAAPCGTYECERLPIRTGQLSDPLSHNYYHSYASPATCRLRRRRRTRPPTPG